MSLQDDILEELHKVSAERQLRQRDAALQATVLRVKACQAARFRHTYQDLAADPRYAQATSFFLEDLYGPQDFSARDQQFARIVPAMTRLFPERIVQTVHGLACLHALSERLDTLMGAALSELEEEPASDRANGPGYPDAGTAPVSAVHYTLAWRAVGHPDDREQQVQLTLSVGKSLDELTRIPMLRTTLRMMRGPANAAGLASLQRFLETGFDTFRAMRGADDFLATIGRRERVFIERLFGLEHVTDETVSGLFP